MKKASLQKIQDDLSNRYQLDLVHDILLNKRDIIVFYADYSNPNPILEIISGDLGLIGFEPSVQLTMDDLMACFDMENVFGDIIGHELYLFKIKKAIQNITVDETVNFPIIKNQKRYWIQMTLNVAKYTPSGQPIVVAGTLSNISSQKEEENRFYTYLHKDVLTGLFNRRTFLEHLAETNPVNHTLHLMLIDLDNFKLINDQFGHVFGDLALQKFGLFLRSLVTDYLIFYRYAGDEFFIQIIDQDADFVKSFADKLLAITPTISIHEAIDFRMSLSIGIYHPKGFADSVTEMIHKCDMAMYEAKRLGKNQYCFFDSIEANYTPPVFIENLPKS